MRIAVAAGAGSADGLQQFEDAIGAVLARNAAGNVERLGDAIVDAHPWIERTIGALKHELQAAAHVGQMLETILACDGFAEQFDMAAGRRDQADEQPADGRFARLQAAASPQQSTTGGNTWESAAASARLRMILLVVASRNGLLSRILLLLAPNGLMVV
jgi:hypothetical protein